MKKLKKIFLAGSVALMQGNIAAQSENFKTKNPYYSKTET